MKTRHFILALIVAIAPVCGVSARDTSMMKVEQLSASNDEFQAEIPLHRANWKLAMERALDYVKNGDYVEAQRMVEIARNEASQTGVDDPTLAETEKMAGDIYVAQKNPTQAERSYRRSVYLFERAFAPDKSEFAAALLSYASFLKQSNRVREASRFEARANLVRGNDNSTAVSHRSL